MKISALSCLAFSTLLLTTPAHAQLGSVRRELQLPDPSSVSSSGFGYSLAVLGDLNGDGFADLAVGAPFDLDATASSTGSVWILFLDAHGSVLTLTKIGQGSGGFSGT